MTVHSCEVASTPVECAERRLCVASAYPWAATADYAGTEAQAMGCGFEDPAEMRRAEAAEAAAKAMAHLFERRANVPMPAEDGSS